MGEKLVYFEQNKLILFKKFTEKDKISIFRHTKNLSINLELIIDHLDSQPKYCFTEIFFLLD